MRRAKRHVLLATALLFWGARPALGQAPEQPPPGGEPGEGREITVVLEPGQRPALRLAFPAVEGVEGVAGAAGVAARELEETLRADLQSTRIFSMQGPAELAVAQMTGDRARDAEILRSLGNEIWLAAGIRVEGEKLIFEGRIFDLQGGDQIVGKRYSGGFDLARRIAHTFNDEVVLYFTGRPGIALTSLAFSSDRSGQKEIYLMDYDGRSPRPITAHRSTSMSPEWSPGGAEIAYVSYFEGSPGIFRVDLASGAKAAIVSDDGFNISPTFSPDGRRIAFARSLDGNTEIFTSNRDGSGLLRLTHAPGIDTNPAWSPTGREIAFTSSRTGSPQIFVMDAEGANLRRLTFEGDYNDGAAWEPKGDRLAFASRRNGRFEIAVLDLVTLETRVVTSGPGSNESPTFSPDGRKIAFASTGGGRGQIFVIDRDGANRTQLTREGGNWAPAWSPYPQ